MPSTPNASADSAPEQATSLLAVLVVTALCSAATGVFWNGLAFVVEEGYGFSARRNLVLYVCMGAVYMVGAWRSGVVSRWCSRWASVRGQLVGLITIQAVLCLPPILAAHEAAVWISALGVQMTSSMIWPIVEGYLTAGRHGKAMRRAIGQFNLVWTAAVAVSLVGIAPLLENHAAWAIGGMTFVNAAAALVALWFRRTPGAHDEAHASANVPPEYAALLRSSRILLPTSYFLMAALSPLLPYLLEARNLPLIWKTPCAATWTVVRVFALAVMWRANFWHGRWGALLLGFVCLGAGFALTALGPNLAVMMIGLGLFGVGVGVVYYAALYYGMAVGRAEVDAGGAHEGLIGVGYTIGPLAALIAPAGPALVGVMLTGLGLAAIPAAAPYWRTRRRASGR